MVYCFGSRRGQKRISHSQHAHYDGEREPDERLFHKVFLIHVPLRWGKGCRHTFPVCGLVRVLSGNAASSLACSR